jgi:hypothetical protein
LACGKGRHSIPFKPTRVWCFGCWFIWIVSPKRKDTNDMHFKVHDMRVPLKSTMLYLICLPALVISKMKRITYNFNSH